MKPDIRDFHIYGGSLIVAVGVGWMTAPGWGLALLGALWFYLGVWRMGG